MHAWGQPCRVCVRPYMCVPIDCLRGTYPRAMPAPIDPPNPHACMCVCALVRLPACAVPGFYEAVRAYICQTLSLSFSRITRATLASCLQLQGDTLAAFVSACAGGSWLAPRPVRPALP